MSRNTSLLIFVTIALALTGLHAMTGRPPQSPPGKTLIRLWHPWPGSAGMELRRLVDVFNRENPKVKVDILYVPQTSAANQKLFLAISAGAPPDCSFVGGQEVPEWAARGAIQPLDELMAKHDIRNEDFWGPCARQTQFMGRTYAITYCADPNFAFFWNRESFRDAGLLEHGPPRTLEEMDDLARKLTKRDKQGKLVRIGFIPWNVFGYPNSIFTWGWAFGGEFYDEKEQRIICGENPGVLEAARWMKSYADEYGFESIASFAEGFGDMSDNPFLRGKIAMCAGHVSNIPFFEKYAPDLDYGIVPFPYPQRFSSDQSAWMGGWCMGIPRGSKHPEEAFIFMKWLCASAESGISMVETVGQLPGYKPSKAFTLVNKKPKLAVFYDVLQNTRHQRPVMPAQAYLMGALDRAVSRFLTGQLTPEAALMQAQEETQKELDRVLKRAQR